MSEFYRPEYFPNEKPNPTIKDDIDESLSNGEKVEEWEVLNNELVEQSIDEVLNLLPKFLKVYTSEPREFPRNRIHVFKRRAAIEKNLPDNMIGYYEPLKHTVNVIDDSGMGFWEGKDQIRELERKNKKDGYYSEQQLRDIIDRIRGETNNTEKLAFAHSLSHELLHAFSKNILDARKLNKSYEFTFDLDVKSGYSSHQFIGNTSDIKRSFYSLNETVTESLSIEFMKEYENQIGFNMNGVPDDIREALELNRKILLLPKYTDDIKLFDIITDKLGFDSKQKIYEEYFDGSIMHLREIDKFFGKGALRLYASLPPINGVPAELKNLIFDFFSNPSSEKLVSLSEALLGYEQVKGHAPKISKNLNRITNPKK